MAENKKSLKSKIVTAAIVAIGVICLALFLSCTVFRKNKDRPAFVFGYAYLYVETGSMESTIPARSYIFVRKAGKTAPKTGDVIVFICRDPSLPVYGKMVTHRVVDVTENGEYVTKGDNPLSVVDKTSVKKEDVVAFYVRNSKILTFFGRLFASKAGLAIIIGMFAFAVVFVYLPDMIKGITEEKVAEEEKERKESELRARIEEEVRRLEREGIPAFVNKPDETDPSSRKGENPDGGADGDSAPKEQSNKETTNSRSSPEETTTPPNETVGESPDDSVINPR